jgi:tryptophanyl-tRNA synthetase
MDDPAVKKSLKHGLFSYPILQAADVLIHRATHVPVGEDQRQHLEFSRECVTNFNSTYKTDCLVAPKTLISSARRVMSLTKPQQKMSKSDPSSKSRILITDSPEEIRKRIRGATTDSIEGVTYDPENRPGVANLIEILSGFDAQKRTASQLGVELQGSKILDLKNLLAQAVCDELAEVRDRYQFYLSQKDQLREYAAVGNQKAAESARRTMELVNEAVGLGPLR